MDHSLYINNATGRIDALMYSPTGMFSETIFPLKANGTSYKLNYRDNVTRIVLVMNDLDDPRYSTTPGSDLVLGINVAKGRITRIAPTSFNPDAPLDHVQNDADFLDGVTQMPQWAAHRTDYAAGNVNTMNLAHAGSTFGANFIRLASVGELQLHRNISRMLEYNRVPMVEMLFDQRSQGQGWATRELAQIADSISTSHASRQFQNQTPYTLASYADLVRQGKTANADTLTDSQFMNYLQKLKDFNTFFRNLNQIIRNEFSKNLYYDRITDFYAEAGLSKISAKDKWTAAQAALYQSLSKAMFSTAIAASTQKWKSAQYALGAAMDASIRHVARYFNRVTVKTREQIEYLNAYKEVLAESRYTAIFSFNGLSPLSIVKTSSFWRNQVVSFMDYGFFDVGNVADRVEDNAEFRENMETIRAGTVYTRLAADFQDFRRANPQGTEQQFLAKFRNANYANHTLPLIWAIINVLDALRAPAGFALPDIERLRAHFLPNVIARYITRAFVATPQNYEATALNLLVRELVHVFQVIGAPIDQQAATDFGYLIVRMIEGRGTTTTAPRMEVPWYVRFMRGLRDRLGLAPRTNNLLFTANDEDFARDILDAQTRADLYRNAFAGVYRHICRV